ncbi:MAG: hypothetical protein JWM17_510, partial [Actinobacteria bacterium]|nr:hypothetical protein [Actinomycetota bacterium]
MASVRTCLLAATAATAALFVTLAVPPVEAQLIPFPTPLLPGLVGPSPSAAPAPAAPAASAPAKAPAPGARAKPSGNAPANAPQNTRASSSSKKSPSVQAATSAGSGPA